MNNGICIFIHLCLSNSQIVNLSISQEENNNGILTGLFFARFISTTILYGIIII